MLYRSPADWWTTMGQCSNRFAEAVAGARADAVDAVSEALDRHAETFAQPDGTLRVPARTWVAWAAA